MNWNENNGIDTFFSINLMAASDALKLPALILYSANAPISESSTIKAATNF